MPRSKATATPRRSKKSSSRVAAGKRASKHNKYLTFYLRFLRSKQAAQMRAKGMKISQLAKAAGALYRKGVTCDCADD